MDKILAALDTDYVDLLLMHWPFPLQPNAQGDLIPRREDGARDHDEEWDIKDTWKQLEAVQRSGKLPDLFLGWLLFQWYYRLT